MCCGVHGYECVGELEFGYEFVAMCSADMSVWGIWSVVVSV